MVAPFPTRHFREDGDDFNIFLLERHVSFITYMSSFHLYDDICKKATIVMKGLFWLTVLRPQSGTITWGHGQVAHRHGNTWKEILTNWTASRKRGRGGLGFYSLHLGCVTHGKKTSLKVSSPPQLYHLSPKHLMCGLFRDIYTDNSEISRQVEINCKACFLF